MSLRDKNRQVLDDGAAARATFQPPIDGAPVRAYQYWLKSSGREPFRENFCHFWRVVLIWAPLYWVGNHTLVPFFESRPVRAMGRGIAWVFQKPHAVYRSLPYEKKKQIEKIGWGVVFTLLSLTFLGSLIGLAFSVGFVKFLVGLLIAVAVMGAFVGLIAGLGYFADKWRAKAEARREAEAKRIAALPYDEWLIEVGLRKPPRDPKWYDKYVAKVKAGVNNVGDFLVLIVNVVRVKKWKICPLVEIPNSQPERVDNGVTGW